MTSTTRHSEPAPNAFTAKPDVSKFVKNERARTLSAAAASKRVQHGGQHLQSKNTDIRKTRVEGAK